MLEQDEYCNFNTCKKKENHRYWHRKTESISNYKYNPSEIVQNTNLKHFTIVIKLGTERLFTPYYGITEQHA